MTFVMYSRRSALDAPIQLSHQRLETPRETDAHLLERLRAGEEPAFRQLYERYFQRVYNFLDRRLRNRADTEETTQEVFINLFASLDSYRGDAPFAAWVFGVTRRTLASRFKRKRHPTVPLLDAELEGAEWIADWRKLRLAFDHGRIIADAEKLARQ